MTTNLAVVVPASVLAASDYRLYNVYICSPTYKYKPTSHMAFYANGRVERIVPAIRGQVESVTLSEEVIRKRNDIDAKTRALLIYLVEQLSAAKDYRYNEKEYKIILLSGKGDPDTIFLPHEIENDLTTPSGRRQAFARGHRYITVEKLLTAPKTTSGLLEVEAKTELLSKVQETNKNTTECDRSIQNPFISDKTIEQLLKKGYTGVDYELAANNAFAAAAYKFQDEIKWTRTKPDENGEVSLMTHNTEEFGCLLEFMLEKFGWCPQVYSLDEETEIFVFTPQNELEEVAIELTTSGEYGWKGSLYSLNYSSVQKNELCLIFSIKPTDSDEQEWLLVKVDRSKNTRSWSVHDGTLEQIYYIWAEQIGIPEPNFYPTTDEVLDAVQDEYYELRIQTSVKSLFTELNNIDNGLLKKYVAYFRWIESVDSGKLDGSDYPEGYEEWEDVVCEACEWLEDVVSKAFGSWDYEAFWYESTCNTLYVDLIEELDEIIKDAEALKAQEILVELCNKYEIQVTKELSQLELWEKIKESSVYENEAAGERFHALKEKFQSLNTQSFHYNPNCRKSQC